MSKGETKTPTFDYAKRAVTYATDIKSAGRAITLKQAIENIRGGGNHSSDWSNKVLLCRSATDPKERDRHKRNLPAIYFSGEFQTGKKPAKERLTKHSGLMCLDIDGKDNEGATVNDMRAKVDADPHTLASFISPTGNGLKVIVPVTATDGATHERCFAAAAAHYAQRLGIAIDAQCKDVSRACFVSYDPAAILNESAEPFAPAPQAPAAPAQAPAPAVVAPVVADEDTTRRAVAYLDKMPPAISGQGGHVALFKAAAALTVKFGLDDETAFALLQVHYNPRCEPPWDEKDLRHKVTESRKATKIRPLPERLDDEQFRVWVEKAAANADETEPAMEEEFAPFPRDLLSLGGGLIDVFAEHANLSTEHPNPVCNFFAGVAMEAALAGRRYVGMIGKTRVYPREYFIVLAPSSGGKNQGRTIIQSVYAEVNAPGLIYSAGSGEGIEDTLIKAGGASLYLADEVQGIVAAIADERAGNPLFRAGEILLSVYTAAGGYYKRRALSKGNQKRPKDDEGEELEPLIKNPCLSWYGCSTPDEFYKACNERLFCNGLIGRCVIIEGDPRSHYGRPARELAPLPQILLNYAKHCMDISPDAPRIVEADAAALARYEAVQVAADDEYDKATSEAGRALWGRMAEHAGTLALLAAISRDYRAPVITPDCVEWGVAVASWSIRRTLARYADKETPLTVGRAQFNADLDRVKRALPPKGKTIEHSRLLRRCKLPAHSFHLAIETLIQSREVEVFQAGKERQQSTIYRRL